MSYKKFKSFVEKGDAQGVTEFVEEIFLKNDGYQSNSNYEDYNILKYIIRHGKKYMIRKCIEKGFPVNIDREDQSFDGTPLHIAVLSDCPETVQLLLDNGSCIYRTNGNEETPLLLSAIAGNDRITDILLSRIEPREYFNGEGFSHFHVACMRNQVELVHQFLIFGTDIHHSVKKNSQFWSGFTPLHFAVECRSIETVEFLVKSGADITIQNQQGLTPLHLAFRKRNKQMIDILLSAQCFFVLNPLNREGLSHFHIACATNNEVVVKDFLEKKLMDDHSIPHDAHNWVAYDAFCFAIYNNSIDVLKHLLKSADRLLKKIALQILDDAYVKSSQEQEVFNLIVTHFEKAMVKFQSKSSLENSVVENQEYSAEVQSKLSKIQVEHFERFEISQQTKLHVAVLHKDKVLVSSILETHHPSIITIADARGKTPLHLAFEINQIELEEQLLRMHFKIDENPADKNGVSHFHIACTTANVNVVKHFLKKGVDVDSFVKIDSPIWAGYTPLFFAVQFCQIEVAKLLLTHGANYAVKDSPTLSSFNFAIPYVTKLSYKISDQMIEYKDDEDEWELVKVILLANKDRKIVGFDDRGVTLLHIAAMNNDAQTINNLANADTINKVTDLNLPRCYAGLTPLHFAVRFGKKKAAEILLDHGADVTIQNVEKNTAAHMCKEKWFCEKIGCELLSGRENVHNNVGVSLFHLACKYKNMEVIQHFLNLKVDVNEAISLECKNEGKTPLHLAVEADDSKIVELLLDHGANVNARDRFFASPISLCKSAGVFKILLYHGADLQALDYRFRTAFSSISFYRKNRDYLIALIESGWDINVKNEILCIQVVEPIDYFAKFTLIRHIESLMMLGVELKAQIKNLYNNLVSYRGILTFRNSFKEESAVELNLMKNVKIDARTTLYDILLKSSTEMVQFSRNETFRKIVESEQDLRQRYPNYAYLVILQFKKGTKRAMLLEQGKASLSFIAKKWMGDLAFENILQFFNDYEVQYLIDATSGRNILDRKF